MGWKRMKNFNSLGIHWKIWLLEGCSWKTNIEGGIAEKERHAKFVDCGAWQERGGRGWCFGGGLIPQCTLSFKFTYNFLTFFFLIFLFPFFISFLWWNIKYLQQNIYQSKNQNRWSEIVGGTVCAIVMWLTPDEWFYLLANCPNWSWSADSNPTDGLSRVFGPNLITRLQVTFWLN